MVAEHGARGNQLARRVEWRPLPVSTSSPLKPHCTFPHIPSLRALVSSSIRETRRQVYESRRKDHRARLALCSHSSRRSRPDTRKVCPPSIGTQSRGAAVKA